MDPHLDKMTLLPHPFVAAGASTRLLLDSRFGGIEWGAAEGSLIPASYSEAEFVKIACYSPAAPPLLYGIAFSWVLCVKPPRTGGEKAHEAGGVP